MTHSTVQRFYMVHVGQERGILGTGLIYEYPSIEGTASIIRDCFKYGTSFETWIEDRTFIDGQMVSISNGDKVW